MAGPGAPRGATGVGLFVLLVILASALVPTTPARATDTAGPGRTPTGADYAEAVELGEERREEEEAGAVEEPTGPLGDEEALALAEEAFGPQLEAAAGIFTGLEVQKFLSGNAAVIEGPVIEEAQSTATQGRSAAAEPGEGPYEGPALLESSVPLQTPDALGLPAPVDLGLEAAPDGTLAPANPLAELSIPAELSEGVALPEAGVTLTFPELLASSEPTTAAEAVAFYPNAAPETDLAVSPTPEGAETFSVLRTEAAPKSTQIDLAMSAGAELRATTNGGAEVLESGDPKLEVRPPHASDAGGRPVPASLAVEGNTITVSAEPGADAQYPILLDPEFIENFDSTNGSWKEIGAWSAERTNEPAMRTLPYSYSQGPSRPGLDMDAGYLASRETLRNGDEARWSYYVPRYASDRANTGVSPTSFINRMGSSYVDLETFGDNHASPYLVGSIWLENVGWLGQPVAISGTEGDRLTSWYFTNPGTDHRAESARVSMISTEEQTPPIRRNAYVDKIFVETADGEPPGAGPAFGPTPWIDTVKAPISYNVTDSGLGVAKLTIDASRSGETAAEKAGKVFTTAVPVETGSSTACLGTVLTPCPRQAGSKVAAPNVEIQPNYNPAVLPTGEDQAFYTATDPVGRVSSAKPFWLKVDHTKPVVTLSGSLTEQATLGDGLNEYTLEYTATDGNAAVAQSGVKSVEVKLDGTVVKSEAPGCTTKNCPITGKWTLDASQFSYGKHTVEVIATDALGHKSTLPPLPIELLDVQQPPVAAYSFDENTGTVAHDASGNAHEGALSAKGVEWAPGKYGPGLRFTGSEGCVTIADSAALRLREEFTLESWVKPEGALTNDPAIYKEVTGESFPSYALGVGLSSTGKAEGKIGTQSKSTLVAASPTAIEANVWSHLALTYDGAALRLYVNGSLVATKAVEKANSASLGSLEIGCDKIHGAYFKGRIDEVRIYNRALEAPEIAADRTAPIQTPQAGPVAKYSFDESEEGKSKVAHDSSGGKHEGTLSAEGVKNGPPRAASAPAAPSPSTASKAA